MPSNRSTLIKIAALLSDQAYHDGNSMGEQLHISRAAVWKAVKKLIQYGVAIKSVKGKGYILEEPFLLLDIAQIKQQLPPAYTGLPIQLFERLHSTNDYLWQTIDPSEPVTICVTELQTQGKGRMNRVWHCPFGKNVCLSLSHRFAKDISELSGLSLIVGLAVAQTIDRLTPSMTDPITVKWPNDVQIGSAKIAGILIELQAEAHGYCRAIIGIGLNVNMRKTDDLNLGQPWTSLTEVTQQYYDRNTVCATLIEQLLLYLDRFNHYGLSDFIEEWQQRDRLFKETVHLCCGETTYTGTGAGINSQGHFLLRMPDQTLRAFSSGDTQLLKK